MPVARCARAHERMIVLEPDVDPVGIALIDGHPVDLPVGNTVKRAALRMLDLFDPGRSMVLHGGG